MASNLTLKKLSIALFTTSVGLLCALLICLLVPVTPERGVADPAVIFANANQDGGPPLREAYFEHKGERIHYVYTDAPTDDVVLFIHGFPSYWYSFIRQIQAVKGKYRIVAIDGLGAGRSDVPRKVDAYTLEAMTGHVYALIDHLGAENVHLVGHDWGAAFALGFAQRYSERVRTVTGLSAPPQSVILELLATNASQKDVFAYVEQLKKANTVVLMALGAPDRVWKGAYAPLLEAGKLGKEEAELFRQATANPKRINAHINWYRANIPAVEDIVDSNYWPARKAPLTVPTLFIWGTEDPIVTPAVIAELESIAYELDLMPLEAVGHWPQFERPDKVTSSITAFLAEHSASRID